MEEKRWHPRVEEQDRVKISILSCRESPEIEGRAFFCSTRDISATGVRFCVHTKVPAGAEVELDVQVKNPEDRFVHRGEAVWAREVEEDGFSAYYLGVHFNETLGNRQVAWRTMVQRRLKALGVDPDEGVDI